MTVVSLDDYRDKHDMTYEEAVQILTNLGNA